LDNEDDFLDEASDPAPPVHPPANRIAAFQAGVQQRTQDALSTQGQAAAAPAKRGKIAPQQAAAQEVTQPAVAADAGGKQGKKRGSKKQAQKVG